MRRFALSQAAQSDLNGIVDYSVEHWGSKRTRFYVDALEGRLKELAQKPQMGVKRNELADGLLSFPFEGHVIFYQRTNFGIVVVRILHKRQDAPAHFDP